MPDNPLIYDFSCLSNVYATQALTVAQYIPWAGFSTLRILALGGSSRWMLASLVMALSLVPIRLNLV